MKLEKIIEFAKKHGYSGAEYSTDWKGYEVYEPYFDGEETRYVGLPYIILVKGDKIRLSTPDESFEFIDNH